jgi:enoyl-CoA hydratase/carnithine racemase
MSLLIEREERVLHITLNRPEKRNALDTGLCEQLVAAIDAVQNDPHVGAILLDAAGKVFCAGMDLEEAVSHPPNHSLAVHERLFSLGRESLKPIVVSVGGAALGGGTGLVAQGHVVVAAQGSLFGLTEIRLGLWPFLIYRAVEEALGPRRTLELSLTGRVFSAADALTWGLVHQVALPFELEDRASSVARAVAGSSPLALQSGMEFVRRSAGANWVVRGAMAAEYRVHVMSGADFGEGVAAFREHRDPQWPSLRRDES